MVAKYDSFYNQDSHYFKQCPYSLILYGFLLIDKYSLTYLVKTINNNSLF